MALAHSQAQQQSTLKGDTGAVGAQGNSVSDNGYNAGTLRVKDTSVGAPADGNAAETATTLVDITFPNPAFGAPSAATPSVMGMSGLPLTATIAATGTAGYTRLRQNTDVTTSSTTKRRIQTAVGTSGSDVNWNTLSLVLNGTASLTVLNYQHPA